MSNGRFKDAAFRRVFVVDRLGDDLAAALARVRPDLDVRAVTADELRSAMPGEVDVIVGFRRPPRISLEGVQWVHSCGAGVDSWLDGTSWPTSTRLTRTTGRLGERMAEHCLARALAETQRLRQLDREQREGIWHPVESTLLCGSCVLVVGCGSVGQPVARAFKSLGCRVVGVSMHGGRQPEFDEMIAVDQIDERLREAAWVVLAMPLTTASRDFFNRERFSNCRGAYLINLARGELIVEDDLIQAIDEGRLRGAALDVFRQEPLSGNSPLWSHPAITLSPHVSGLTRVEEAAESFLECLDAFEADRIPELSVSLNDGY